MRASPSPVASRRPPSTADLGPAAGLVLIVDDDPDFVGHAAAILQSGGYRAEPVSGITGLRDRLARTPADCVLVDYRLSTANGGDLIADLHRMATAAPAVVIATAAREPQLVIKAFRIGADDVVLKSALPAGELLSAVGRAVALRSDAETQHAELERLKRHSSLDVATGFYSRSEIEARLVRMAESADRTQSRFALVACSVRALAGIADEFGLAMADRIARAAAQHLRQVIREGDICGRYDETTFLLIVRAGVSGVDALCQRIAAAIDFDFQADAARLHVQAYAGGAIYPYDGDVPGELIDAAMAALAANEPAPPAVQPRPRPVMAPAPAAEDGGAAEAAEADAAAQRRRHRRQRVFKSGLIVLNDGYSTIDCVIRDISPAGARLMVHGRFTAPPEFELLIKDEGARRQVARRWQVDAEIGVEFAAEGRPA